MVATEVRSGAASVFSSHHPGIDLLATLKASSAIPIFYHRPVTLDGRRYVDGSLVEPVPIEPALRDGCTDILVILTLPKAVWERPPGVWERRVAHRWLRPLSDELADGFRRRHEAMKRALDLIAGRARPAGRPAANIVAVFPDPRLTVGSFTIRRPRLKRAAIDAAWRVMRLFSDAECRPAELIQFVGGPMGFATGL